MIAQELLTDLIPSLNLDDSGEKALSWMTEFQVRHLPIVDGSKYISIISEDEIYDMNAPEIIFREARLTNVRTFVRSIDHIFEVLRVMTDLKLSLVPVVDLEENYLGSINLPDLSRYLADLNNVTEPGAILVLEMNLIDYSLNEIARIVEGNNVQVLSSTARSFKDSKKMEVTLKLNKSDLKNVIATFEANNYLIKGMFQETGAIEDLKDRFDSLMNYLNI